MRGGLPALGLRQCKDAAMDTAAVSRWRRLTRAVVYAVVVAVPLGMLAFLIRTKYDPLVILDQDIIVAATDYTRGHPRFRSVRRDLGDGQPAVGDVPVPGSAGEPLRLVRQAPADTGLVGAGDDGRRLGCRGRAQAPRTPCASRDRRPDRPARRVTRSPPVTPPTTPSSSPWSSLLSGHLVGTRRPTAADRPRCGLGDRDLCRQALRGRPLPVRRHGRRAARMRADARVLRGLHGLDTTRPHRSTTKGSH